MISHNTNAQDVIVSFGSISKYGDNFQTPSTQGALVWSDSNYNDSGWSSGPAQLGYGDGDESTTISSVRTAYFRNTFSLPNLCNYSNVKISVKLDDGVIVYVNGTEVDRYRMPSGGVSYNTFASTTSSDNELRTVTVNTNLFNNGQNVVAVEIHQRSSTSSDLSYDLKVEGLLSAAPCTCVNGMILDVDNDGICDDFDSCIGSACELDLGEFSLCSRINIDQIVNDLSGIAYNNDQNRFIVVENGTPQAMELDLSGNYIRTISLNGFVDTEGITYAGNNQYFILEERKRDIVLITIPPGSNNITINHPGSNSRIDLGITGGNDGLEGITYDRVNDVIYTVKEKTTMKVYKVTNPMSRLGTTYNAPEAFNVVNTAPSYPGSITDLAGTGITTFGTLLILSDEGSRIIEVDPSNGNYISDLNLALSGTPQPEGLTVLSDSEIVVVGETNEFLIYKRVGGTCTDGNPCTINDTIDNNCNCVGVNQDSDNDGICDGQDSCPNLNNSIIGSSCSDGNVCTINDTWRSNCLCEGVLSDTDNDGICDGQDTCPNLNNNSIGSSCNDGDPCTTNDVWLSNCSCQGSNLPDSDNDGICDAQDSCPNLNNNNIGSTCNDGNPCTTNDVWLSNCSCQGSNLPDSDNDGVCDSLDNCPSITNSNQLDSNNNGIGNVCEANSNCQNIISENDNFVMSHGNTEAIQLIKTNRVGLSPRVSNYSAGICVEMTAGFEVRLGATFTARIQACQ